MDDNKYQIKSVVSKTDLSIFLSVPAKVYKKDPYWVEPLQSSIKKQLSANNPFNQYGQHQSFIAISTQSGEPLGRIVVAINHRLIEREKKAIGLFGYFECIHDFQVAQALLEKACQWLRDRNINRVRGPINLSIHNNCLFMVQGFESSPMIMMPYNPPYYPQFMEMAGLKKAKDAYAYDFPLNKPLPEQFEKGYKIAYQSGITFRSLRLKGKGFEEDVHNLYHLFTDAFAHNWSSTPRTEAEFIVEAKDLQSLADPDLFIIAEDQGKMIGFWMSLPDYNMALKYVQGKLNWLGIIKFFWYRRYINQARVLAMCSLPEYRRKMVPLALIYLGMQGGMTKNKPYKRAELSWVWEDNFPSRKLIEATGAKIYKTYRIYEKQL